ncbi:MAG: adenylate kinase [Candidatus Nanopelagicales bacterium]|nr:adenylate kinase [Candidatus Nanopelagicales bacterium]
MRLIVMGPPGAGKGTQATVVAANLGIPHVSTGDLFRANVGQGSELGLEAKRYMDAGEYVPDSITNAMLRDRITHDDCRPGFLLDGYPRTLDQVNELDMMLAASGQALDRTVELTVDTDEVVERLLKRAQDQGRTDDTAEVIRRRLEVYAEQTAPLTAVYEGRGLLVRVDGLGDVAEVTRRILAALAN